jgi:hypothetical protein
MSAGGPWGPPGAGPPPNPYGPTLPQVDNPYGPTQPQLNPYAPPAPGYDAGYPQGGGYPPQGGYPIEYELNEEENRVVAGAALWARVLGITLIVEGVAQIVQINVIGAALSIAIGAMLISAAGSFSAVVNTQGNDIGNLMQAISKVGTVFKIRVILFLVALGLAMVAMVCVFGFFTMMHGSR